MQPSFPHKPSPDRPPSRDDLFALTSFACLLAEKSGKIIQSVFHKAVLDVEEKEDGSPVTAADRDAEALMRDLITKEYPSHGVIGEEGDDLNRDAEWTWVLDPIDGTKSFTCGVPLFGTLIALQFQGHPVIGVIHHSALNLLVVGVQGEPTTVNGRKVRVSETKSLEQARMVTTDHLNVARYQDGPRFQTLCQKVKLYRQWGDCYMYTLLAQGKIDIAIDPIMNPWDIKALIPVIVGAGGVITDYQGQNPVCGSSIIASNPCLHPQIIGDLNAI